MPSPRRFLRGPELRIDRLGARSRTQRPRQVSSRVIEPRRPGEGIVAEAHVSNPRGRGAVAGLQSRQLPAAAGPAKSGEGVVTAQPSTEAYRDWCHAGTSRPAAGIPTS
jgi:hypothetical protein